MIYLHHFAVGCNYDEVRCPNMDQRCQNKLEYMKCETGEYRDRCLETSAACDNMEKCSSKNFIYYCSKLWS